MVQGSELPELPDTGHRAAKGPPPNLDTVPTELLEQIVSGLANEDIIHLRLTNSAITAKTFRPFAKRFLTNQTWQLAKLLGHKHYNLRFDGQVGKIGGLVLVPKFLPQVKNFELKFANKFEVSFRVQALARDINLLENLQSFTFEGAKKPCASGNYFTTSSPNFWSQVGHADLFNQLRLSRLEHLTIKSTCPLLTETIGNLIQNHQKTLKSVKLIHVSLVDDKEVQRDDRSKWLSLLPVLKGMQPDAKVKISVPRVLRTFPDSFRIPSTLSFNSGPSNAWYGNQDEVSFKPWKDGRNTSLIQIFDGMLHGWDGAHYSSVQGQLQQSLDCLIQNYRELVTMSEVRKSGAIFHGEEELFGCR